MSSKWNSESLTRALFDCKRGPTCLVIFSSKYSPSLKLLNIVKRVIAENPSIQIIEIDAEERRDLLNAPFLNITEIPSVYLFNKGRVLCQSLTDTNLVVKRLRYLAAQSMEVDDFEPVGTAFKASHSCKIDRWRLHPMEKSNVYTSYLAYAISPLWTIMESLYDI